MATPKRQRRIQLRQSLHRRPGGSDASEDWNPQTQTSHNSTNFVSDILVWPPVAEVLRRWTSLSSDWPTYWSFLGNTSLAPGPALDDGGPSPEGSSDLMGPENSLAKRHESCDGRPSFGKPSDLLGPEKESGQRSCYGGPSFERLSHPLPPENSSPANSNRVRELEKIIAQTWRTRSVPRYVFDPQLLGSKGTGIKQPTEQC